MAKIRLIKVHCSKRGEKKGSGTGGDDLYVKYQSDAGDWVRYPSEGAGKKDLDAGEEWIVDLDILYSNSLRIDLYDSDSTSSDDALGYHVYSASDANTNQVWDTNSPATGQYQFYTGPSPV